MKRRIVLADANIFINLNRFTLFDFIEKISEFYKWDIGITPGVNNECEDLFTASTIESMLKKGIIKLVEESQKEVTLLIEKLEIIMEKGAEIELFAIAKYRGFNILTDDIENTRVFKTKYSNEKFWVYNFEKLLYLAYKANILSMDQIQSALEESDRSGLRKISHPAIREYGFGYFCEKLDENVDKHIDPEDQAKFLNLKS